MTERLHDLLESDQPTSLAQLEHALASQDKLSADQEAVLSALIWRRRTNGGADLLGTVLYQDCASRIGDLPEHLEAIGAGDAARAVNELFDVIPLSDEEISKGLVDWVETEPEVVREAKALGEDLEDIDAILWQFMKAETSDIPDLEIQTRRQRFVSALRDFLRSGSPDR